MADVEKMISEVLMWEGGYVDDPLDHGGPTNMGITMGTLAAYRGTSVSQDDVRNLTKDEAVQIYKREYFEKPGFDRLPEAVQAQVFDIGVNSGVCRAVKLLQQALNDEGQAVAVDGDLGPATVAAAAAVDPLSLNDALVDRRIKFLQAIVANDPSQGRFLTGWLRRARYFA